MLTPQGGAGCEGPWFLKACSKGEWELAAIYEYNEYCLNKHAYHYYIYEFIGGILLKYKILVKLFIYLLIFLSSFSWLVEAHLESLNILLDQGLSWLPQISLGIQPLRNEVLPSFK